MGKQLRSFARSLYCDNLSASNLEIMNYISRKSCRLLISGSGTRFVVHETIENGLITLYKSIRALQMCTMHRRFFQSRLNGAGDKDGSCPAHCEGGILGGK